MPAASANACTPAWGTSSQVRPLNGAGKPEEQGGRGVPWKGGQGRERWGALPFKQGMG